VLVGAAEVEGRRVAVAGVDFEEAVRIKPWWRVYGEVPATPGEVLVGYDAARAFGLLAEAGTGGEDLTSVPVDPWYGVDPETGAATEHAGHGAHHDTVALSRRELTIGGERFRVAGVLEPTGAADDRLVFADLGRAQSMLGRGDELSLVEVSALCTDCPVEEIVAQIQSALPSARVTAVRQAVAARSMTVARLSRFGGGLAVVVLVVAALLVFVTMTSSIAERRREIGVLRAVGFRRAHVLKIIGLEVLALGLVAGLVGWAVGWAAAVATARYFADGAEVAVAIGPLVGALAVAGAVLVGALGALYPALGASSLDPTEALRHV
jgi:putative ABC transport system permease protein